MGEPSFNKGEINTIGYYYQLYTLVHCIDRLRENNVLEYDISNAETMYGQLDDVAFNAILRSGEKITTAIQVKHHINNKEITEYYLWRDKKTYLNKYFESFLKIRETTPLCQIKQLILWTNMPIASDIRKWFEKFEPDADGSDILGESVRGLPYERYRIVNYQDWLTQLKNEHGKVATRTKKIKFTDITLLPEWDSFIKRFVFYVNAPNKDDLAVYLARKIEPFSDLCKLMETCAIQQKTSSNQIERLFTLVDLRNSMELNPYKNLAFDDMDELQEKVEELFSEKTKHSLRVQASQDVDCTVARLGMVVENYLAVDRKNYLALSYKIFNEKLPLLQPIIADRKIIKSGLRCLIITGITSDEICTIEKHLTALKVIFVGEAMQCNTDGYSHLKCYVDVFDIDSIPDQNKITEL